MTLIKIQCRGSGKLVSGIGVNTKRAICPRCHHMQDVRPDGKIRKHKVVTTTRKVKQYA